MRRALAPVLLATACGIVQDSVPLSNHATAPAVGCLTTRTCIDACTHHVMGSCSRAARFVYFQIDYTSAGDSSALYSDSEHYAILGCSPCRARGEPPRRSSRPRRRCEAMPRSRAACKQGAGEGCRMLAERETDPDKKRELVSRAREFLDAQCDGGWGDSCMDLAGMYGGYASFGAGPFEYPQSDDRIRHYMRKAIDAYERACLAGDAVACIDRVWVYRNDQLGMQTPSPRVWVDRTCRLVGATAGCWHGFHPPPFGYDQKTIEDDTKTPPAGSTGGDTLRTDGHGG
jgi:hypothetical protein